MQTLIGVSHIEMIVLIPCMHPLFVHLILNTYHLMLSTLLHRKQYHLLSALILTYWEMKQINKEYLPASLASVEVIDGGKYRNRSEK